MIKTSNAISNKSSTMEIGIHSADNTHHHDQSILPISFKVMNTIVSRPQKPIPDELEDEALIGKSFGHRLPNPLHAQPERAGD